MTDIHLDLAETTIDGGMSRLWSLHQRDCPELAVHRIMHLGISNVASPYRRVRVRPSGSFVMVCHEGQGRILLDGRWQTSRAGVACLAPPRVLNAFHAVAGTRWRFSWIRYDEPSHVGPVVTAAAPGRARCNAAVLERVMEGLRLEWDGSRDARFLHHWIELAHGEARRLTRPRGVDERLWRLWMDVAHDLSADWTLERLALRYGSGKEQLRRLCLKELGRSPMQHLTSLRMERAQELLASTPDTMEKIAQDVGFHEAAVFSRAFKRWVGCSPSHYRQ